jgi:hypothetical protein
MQIRPTIIGLFGSLALGFVMPQIAVASNSVGDGTRTLTVSQSANLSGDGQTVTVTGSGYDTNKGIYVALCVATPKGALPSPCGGGVDMEGDGGASVWISDNPPSYASGLPIAYGAGGSFRVSFKVGPIINQVTDCRAVQCAIVTKNDHTINNDRSQDLQIPVTFTGTPVATAAPKPTVTTKAPQVTTTTASTNDVDESVSSEGDAEDTATTAPASTEEVVTTDDDVIEITVADDVEDLIAVSTATDSSFPILPALGLATLPIVAGVFFAANRRKR